VTTLVSGQDLKCMGGRRHTEKDDIKNQDCQSEDSTARAVLPGVSACCGGELVACHHWGGEREADEGEVD